MLKHHVVATCLVVISMACGSNKTASTSDTSGPTASNNAETSVSPTSADTLIAQQGISAAMDAGAADDGISNTGSSGNSAKTAFAKATQLTSSNPLANTFKRDQCTANITGTTSDVNNTKSIDANIIYNGCQGKEQITGTETIAITWAAPYETSPRNSMVTDNLLFILPNLDTVSVTTLDPNIGYTCQSAATGLPSIGNVNITASLNEHRVRHTQNGNVVFDHNMTTSTPIAITNTYTAGGIPSQRIINGTVNIHHNLKYFNSANNHNNVIRDLTKSCLCPGSGTLVRNITMDNGSGGYTRTHTFTDCGQGTVVTTNSTLANVQNGNSTFAWDNCQN